MTMNIKKKLIATLAFGAALSLGVAACAGDTSPPPDSRAAEDGASTEADGTITQIVAGDSQFSTLLAAVQAADLGETLSSEGPFTVFAPTDDAFGALPEGTLDSLLKPRNVDDLSAILAYHVVSGDVEAADVRSGAVATVNGAAFEVSVDGGDITLTDAAGNQAIVTVTDIQASNGVIHVIDSVLLPPSA